MTSAWIPLFLPNLIPKQGCTPEEVGHGLKGSRTLLYRGHEINMAGFKGEVSIYIDHFYLLVFKFAIPNPQSKSELGKDFRITPYLLCMQNY